MAFIVDTLKYVFRIDNTRLKSGLATTDSRVTKTANHMTSKLGGAIKGIVAAYLGWYAIKKVWTWAIKNAREAEKVYNDLAAAVRISGQAWEDVSEQVNRYTGSMQRMTRFSDEEAAAGLTRLMFYTQDVTEAQKLLTNAIDFSVGMSIDLNASIDLLGKAYVGYTGTLSRYGIIIDQNLSSTEKYAAAMKIVEERVGGRAAAELNTYVGAMAQLKNELNDLGQALGELVLPSLTSVTKELTKFFRFISPETTEADRLRMLIEEIEESIKSLRGEPNKLGKEIVVAFGTAEEAVENFEADLRALRAALFALTGVPKDLLPSVAWPEPPPEARRKIKDELRDSYADRLKLKEQHVTKLILLDESYYDALTLRLAELDSESADMMAGVIDKIRQEMETPLGAFLFKMGVDVDDLEQASADVNRSLDYVTNRLYQFGTEVSQFFSAFISSALSIITKDPLSGILTMLDWMFGFFSADRFYDIEQALKNIRQEFERTIDELREWRAPLSDLQQQLADAHAGIRELENTFSHWPVWNMETIAELSERMGDSLKSLPPAVAELIEQWRQLHGLIEELNYQLGILPEVMDIEGISDIRALFEELAAEERLTWDKASDIINHFAEMWDLSTEEQLSLYELLQELLEQENLTLNEWFALTETIKGLEDDIAEDRRRGAEDKRKGEDEVSQVMRTVTSITERQANMLVGVANTLSTYVWEILQIMRGGYGMGGGAPTGGAGGGTTIGGIYMNFTAPVSAGTAQAFATSFRNELRGKGIQV